jgi:hypothetical protein
MSPDSDGYVNVALDFVRALVARDFDSAYAMTSSEYRRRVTPGAMRSAFDAMVPDDWRDAVVSPGHTMDSWPDKQPSDLGWVYVSIGGDVYSEAATVVVTEEAGTLKVRDVEFGRP